MDHLDIFAGIHCETLKILKSFAGVNIRELPENNDFRVKVFTNDRHIAKKQKFNTIKFANLFLDHKLRIYQKICKICATYSIALCDPLFLWQIMKTRNSSNTMMITGMTTTATIISTDIFVDFPKKMT